MATITQTVGDGGVKYVPGQGSPKQAAKGRKQKTRQTINAGACAGHVLYSVLSYSCCTPIEIPRKNRESTIDDRYSVPHLSNSKERANLHVRLRIPVQSDEQGTGAPTILLASRQHGSESPLSGDHELVQRKSYSSEGTTETPYQVVLLAGLRHTATV